MHIERVLGGCSHGYVTLAGTTLRRSPAIPQCGAAAPNQRQVSPKDFFLRDDYAVRGKLRGGGAHPSFYLPPEETRCNTVNTNRQASAGNSSRHR
ncbi:hypothetical protein NDU88_002136 [Pleurodeles waltl]|uniref:Uncharacterized protein n=1 Tax=Pleurodeles waltl TaxID=8319 RepID=A0AAV7VDW9_PLEWA|nr:hypothetical protein NDU88_002136 [Pleurodeles waltl]